MKRRNFVQSLLVMPATAVAVPQTTTPPPAKPAQGVQKFPLAETDTIGETTQRFFTPAQFGALTKLAETLMPPMKNHPGAIEAQAPVFLDFLISRSPAPMQTLYQSGLNGLNAAAKRTFQKPFAELDAKQADTIIRPLLVARAWEREEPKDPMQHFMAQVHGDLRTATMNSAEWAAAGSSGGRGRFNSGKRTYWKPVDPRVTGV